MVGGPRYRKMYSEFSEGEQHYYACITALDEQVGRLRQELRELGVAENTMFWYCSDNGLEGRTHHRGTYRGSTRGLRGRKRSLFEGGVRVPGILEWPARLAGGRSTALPCSTSDYFPTVLAALGIEAKGRPQPAAGVNLMPLIEGKMSARPSPIAFQTPHNEERGKAARLGSPDHALIGNRYKFLSYLDETRNGEDMLFDVAIDPGERRNLIEARPDVARSMKETLQAWDEPCARGGWRRPR